MNATNVAQDLSVAALTKGLGREGEHTSHTKIRMTVIDWLVMIVVTVPLALDIAWGDVMGDKQPQSNVTAFAGTIVSSRYLLYLRPCHRTGIARRYVDHS